MPDTDLTTLEGLASALVGEAPGSRQRLNEIGTFDGTFCPACGDVRRMRLVSLFWEERWAPWTELQPNGEVERHPDPDPTPALYAAFCVQCDAHLALLVHAAPHGVELLALPSSYGGLATPNTPPSVAYYLDEARRCQAVGARSATVAMYRSALELLLFEQGYVSGMLNAKIEALLRDEKAPSWRDELDPEYLRIVKDLGNAAIHANDGDVGRQVAFEARLIAEVQQLFVELLDTIYERPKAKASRIERLRAVVDSFREPPASDH
jgi:uncharacterized protein DUF4145